MELIQRTRKVNVYQTQHRNWFKGRERSTFIRLNIGTDSKDKKGHCLSDPTLELIQRTRKAIVYQTQHWNWFKRRERPLSIRPNIGTDSKDEKAHRLSDSILELIQRTRKAHCLSDPTLELIHSTRTARRLSYPWNWFKGNTRDINFWTKRCTERSQERSYQLELNWIDLDTAQRWGSWRIMFRFGSRVAGKWLPNSQIHIIAKPLSPQRVLYIIVSGIISRTLRIELYCINCSGSRSWLDTLLYTGVETCSHSTIMYALLWSDYSK